MVDQKRHFAQDLEDRRDAEAMSFYILKVSEDTRNASWWGQHLATGFSSSHEIPSVFSELWVNCTCTSKAKGISFSSRSSRALSLERVSERCGFQFVLVGFSCLHRPQFILLIPVCPCLCLHSAFLSDCWSD